MLPSEDGTLKDWAFSLAFLGVGRFMHIQSLVVPLNPVMNPPADDNGLKPEKLEEEKKKGALCHCDLYDVDIAHKIAQEFLPGLASACVDNTTGALFSNPATVAVEIRREMVDYLIQRCENFVVETLLLNGGTNAELSDDPYDIISNLIDDFASSKQNLFSRVSGWLLSERREDRIDDFVQEMEINGFWLLNRRESVAQTLLRNVDFKNLYHCNKSFKSPEELEDHKSSCSFRTMTCANEGCDYRFSAAQMDQHDSICPFKILNCEQNCSESIMRREMDRHCITVCPMKLVKCPFYSVGCLSSIPQSTIDQHRSENLGSHLLHILQGVHKQASADNLKERVEELCKVRVGKVEKLSSPANLAAARDARSLGNAIKDLEAKLGPLKVLATPKPSDNVTGSTDKKEDSSVSAIKEVRFEESPRKIEERVNSPSEHSDSNDPSHIKEDSTILSTKEVRFEETPRKNEESVNSPSKRSDSSDPSHIKKKLVESQPQPINREFVEPISVQKSLNESPLQNEDGLDSLNKVEVQIGMSTEEKVVEPAIDEHILSPIKVEENTNSLAKREKHADSPAENKESTESPEREEHKESFNFVQESLKESPLQREKGLGSMDGVRVQMEKSAEKKVTEPNKDEHFTTPIKVEEDTSLVAKSEKNADSAESTKSSLREEPNEPSNSEVFAEPTPVKEQPESLSSAAAGVEDVKS
ncbi:hypothetical protein BUALT_Bualt16G0129000 [Buddleja alternifolia]|uniref:TRAF-type domain-containing protein n=1 Tax=Buddleja alternifolia TaxID=168488 RepID=A0AAV6WLX5_9LAMI|nr:hypothetical protein BUALT_Bualt16G0129000 [Buddleja alternifolia]